MYILVHQKLPGVKLATGHFLIEFYIGPFQLQSMYSTLLFNSCLAIKNEPGKVYIFIKNCHFWSNLILAFFNYRKYTSLSNSYFGYKKWTREKISKLPLTIASPIYRWSSSSSLQTLDTKIGKFWSLPPFMLIPKFPSEVLRSFIVRSCEKKNKNSLMKYVI